MRAGMEQRRLASLISWKSASSTLAPAILFLALAAGCTPVHSQCVAMDARVGGGWACAYDVATSRAPWAVQHRFTAALPANPREQFTVEDEASAASQIEAAAGPLGEAAKIVQPTAPLP
jgi:hypothetical protein